jgi:hypothetical protein
MATSVFADAENAADYDGAYSAGVRAHHVIEGADHGVVRRNDLGADQFTEPPFIAVLPMNECVAISRRRDESGRAALSEAACTGHNRLHLAIRTKVVRTFDRQNRG